MADRVKFGPGREAALIAWLDQELLDAQTARQGLDAQHRAWLAQYRVNAKPVSKSFPYEGAMEYTLPLTAIDVDVLYARFMQTIHAPSNLWTMQPLNERWMSAAKPLQDFLQVVDERLLKMFNVNKRVFLETVKLGTGIYKTGWRYERRKVWGYDREGKRVQQERIVSAPFVDHVRLSDWLMPAYSYAIQPDEQGGAPWTAERLRVSIPRLFQLAESSAPFLPTVDKATVEFIARFEEAEKPPTDVKIQELDFARKGEPGSPTKLEGDAFDRDREVGTASGASVARIREVELWEIHARFATQGGASEDDIVVWYHQPTRRIVRAVYKLYDHGARPYSKITYFPGDGFWGVGICEQKEMFQALGSELMNFTLHNVLLANSRMIVAKSGANIGPGEPIYPWKVWLTDNNVRDDFGVFPMADIYPSLPMLQAGLTALGEKRTGIGDLQLAQLNELPGRTPGVTMNALLQEGNRRPDLTIKDMRNEGLSTVGMQVLQMCQQFISSPMDLDGKRWLAMAVDMLGMPEGAEVAKKLMTPMEPMELGIGVSLTATSGSANKEVERQGALALLQLAAQTNPQFIQLVQIAMQAQAAGAQPLADVALNAARGLDQLYRRTLEQFDVRNAEEVSPLGDIVGPQTPGALAAPVGAQPPGGGVPQGTAIDPAMAALLTGFGGGG